jgi:hypothetical protein
MEPASTPAPFLFGRGVARGAAIRAAGVVVPDIIADAPTGHLWGNGRRIKRTGIRSNMRAVVH